MLKHKFVEFVPDDIEDGVVYISVHYCTAIHKCVCGCGNEVVTPLSPTDWRLTFDGKTVSLYPSIGNWNFECQSHYWIRGSQIEYANSWSKKEIMQGRENDQERKEEFYVKNNECERIEEPDKASIWMRALKHLKSILSP